MAWVARFFRPSPLCRFYACPPRLPRLPRLRRPSPESSSPQAPSSELHCYAHFLDSLRSSRDFPQTESCSRAPFRATHVCQGQVTVLSRSGICSCPVMSAHASVPHTIPTAGANANCTNRRCLLWSLSLNGALSRQCQAVLSHPW